MGENLTLFHVIFVHFVIFVEKTGCVIDLISRLCYSFNTVVLKQISINRDIPVLQYIASDIL